MVRRPGVWVRNPKLLFELPLHRHFDHGVDEGQLEVQTRQPAGRVVSA